MWHILGTFTTPSTVYDCKMKEKERIIILLGQHQTRYFYAQHCDKNILRQKDNYEPWIS